MKIETLLSCYRHACNDAYSLKYHKVDSYTCARRERQREAIRNGIIRKFERLEKENFELRVAFYSKDTFIKPNFEMRYDSKDFSWSKMSPFIYLSTEDKTKK